VQSVAPNFHGSGGFQSNGHPDGFANEEYFGIANLERSTREVHNASGQLINHHWKSSRFSDFSALQVFAT